MVLVLKSKVSAFNKVCQYFNLAFKMKKIKYKKSALCLSEELASFYTLRFIHKTVAGN